jgi:hypothetical protein
MIRPRTRLAPSSATASNVSLLDVAVGSGIHRPLWSLCETYEFSTGHPDSAAYIWRSSMFREDVRSS